MTESLDQRLQRQLEELRAGGRLRQPRTVTTLPNGHCRIAGQDLVNFGGNDYLNLAHDSRVCAAFATAASKQVGSTASSLIVGRSDQHTELEDALARFEQCEAALLFPSGFAANLGTVQALAGRDDVLFCERENHASLIDAARTSRAEIQIYDRTRLDQLAANMADRSRDRRQVFIVTDGVFSMDGCIAPLAELSTIAAEHSAALVVDEAHGTGVIGDCGRGASEVTGTESRSFVRVGTLSKAFGGMGGFTVGGRDTIEWLRNAARPQFFSTALPPAMCAAMLVSLRIIEEEPERRTALSQFNRHARNTAAGLGLDVAGNGPAPIIPIIIPDETVVVRVSEELRSSGWFVPAIRPPTVPPGSCRLRMSLSTAHSPDDITAVLERIATLISAPL